MNDINFSKTVRPVSAAIKRPDMFRFSSRGRFEKQRSEMPNLYNPNRTTNRSPSTALEKEKVIEENKQLKTTLNYLNKELVVAKSEVHKKDKEINNKNKFLQDIYADTQNNMLKSQNEVKLLQKLRDNNLLNSIKKQYSDLKKEYQKKEIELDNLKKTLKATKLKEVQSETQIYIEELQKLRSLYDISSQHNILYESVLIENNSLQENLKNKEIEIINLKHDLKDSENRIINQNVRQELSKKDIKEYEKMDNKKLITELNRKTIRIHNLEKELQFYKNRSLINELHDKLKDPLYLSENYNNKQIIVNSFMKNKLLEFSVEKDRTDRENERLKNRISQLEEILKNNGTYEEAKNTSINILSEEQVHIMTYILIKNFEVKRISNKNIAENDLNDNMNNIETNIITRLCTMLKIKNIEDKMKIGVYIRSIFNSCRYDYHIIKNKIISLLSDMIEYDSDQENILRTKLAKKLKSDKNLILSAMQYYDTKNRGYINFIDFRKVLQNLKITLKEKYTEYMIYIMKQIDDENVSLEDLKYNNLISILNQDITNNVSRSKTDNNEILENDDGEVVITIEQFNQKVDKILSKLAEYLLNSKQKVRECFKGIITHESINNESYEAIPLKDFIQVIQNIGIKLDTIDIYCIFTKLKYIDEHETIDLAKLLEEMFNYGIFDENLSKDIHFNLPKSERNSTITKKIQNYLNNNNKNFDNFLFSILSKIFIQKEGGNMVRYIDYNEFMNFLKEKDIINDIDMFSESELEKILKDNKININSLKVLIEKEETEIVNITHKDNYNEESLDLGKIEDGEIEGLDI